VIHAAESAITVADAKVLAVRESDTIAAEDERACRALGGHGAALVPDHATVLTHCNAGALACKGWGTALGVIRSARALGKDVRVIACETRPLLQGARLTAWELAGEGIEVEVIPDSAAAFLMRRGEIDLVCVGADRITRDAVFNKIGTYMHAVAAWHHRLPFYVAAPSSTLDAAHAEREIAIEQRPRDEIARCGGVTVVPEGVKVRNYAFDATPIDLVTAVITERGIFHPPLDFELMQGHRQLPNGCTD
jgi:methylthioribose-1-phosphate isomerase